MLDKKSPLNTLRTGWYEGGVYFWSIIKTILLYSLVVGLPLGILNLFFKVSTSNTYFVWSVLRGIIVGTLGGVLPTIYYLRRKGMKS